MKSFYHTLLTAFILAFFYSYTNAQISYTIGGDNPDFATFNDAVDFLATTTLTETVAFNVRDGVYPESVTIGEVAGASEDNQIIFQGENLTQHAVQLGGITEGAQTATLIIETANYITFRHLAVHPLLEFSNVPLIQIHQKVDHCVLDNIAVVGGEPNQRNKSILVSIDNEISSDNQVTISNCDFSGAFLAIRAEGYGNNSDRLTLNNNRFSTVEMLGSSGYGHHEIHGNTLNNFGSFTNAYAIHIDNGQHTIEITSNQFFYKGASAIEVTNSAGVTESVLVANNFIVADQTHLNSNSSFLSFSDLGQLSCINNTIIGQANASTSPIVSLNNCVGKLLNNLAAQNKFGKFISLDQASVNEMDIDYNSFFTEGGEWGDIHDDNLFGFNLTDWQAATNFDLNSQQVEPYFTGENNYQTFLPEFDGTGTPVTEITTDIEGNPRDPQSADIGAFTFSAPAIDAGLTAIQLPDRPFAAGTHSIAVILRNFGTTTLTTATIEYAVNGNAIQTETWTGTLASGMEEEVVLMNVNLENGIANDLSITVKNPNNTTDEQAYNDEISQERIFAALAGEYVIGNDPTAIFTNLEEAIAVLVEAGTAADVFLNLLPDTYYGRYRIFNYPQIDPAAWVTIQAADLNAESVQLSVGEEHQNVILAELYQCKNIEFRHLTLVDDDNRTDGFFAVYGGQSIYFKHLKMQYIQQANANELGIYNATASDMVIENCEITNAIRGIVMQQGMQDILIKNNIIDAFSTAVFIENAGNLELTENKINQRISADHLPAGYLNFGIDIENVTGNVTIRRNQIKSMRSNALKMQYAGVDSENEVQIVNNVFEAMGLASNRFFYGVSLTGGKNVLFAHNNLLVDYQKERDKGLRLSQNENLQVLNNILINVGTAPLLEFDRNTGNVINDYNILVTNGSTLGTYESSDAADLTEWRQISGQATNSDSFVPIFLPESSYRTYDLRLNARATPLNAVSEDIEQNVRDTQTPDIGAFEFLPPAVDAGIIAVQLPAVPFAPDTYSLTARLKNFGTDELTTAEIIYTVNGIDTQVVWTGNLAANEETDVVLPAYDFTDIIQYTIHIRTNNPNGATDEQDYNDATLLTNVYTALGGTYSVGAVDSDFSTLSLAAEVLQTGGVYDEVIFEIAMGSYAESLTIGTIPGAANDRRTTFRSATGDRDDVQLSEGMESYFLLLDGTQFLTFSEVSYVATQTSQGFIHAKGNAQHLIFSDSKFTTDLNIEGRYVLLEAENEDELQHNIIRDNKFIGNRIAVSIDSEIADNSRHNQIINNKFTEQEFYSIYVNNQQAMVIDYNVFQNTLLALLANRISGSTVHANQVYAANKSSFGMSFQRRSVADAEVNVVSNNFITATTSGISGGMEFYEVENYQVLHNTIDIDVVNSNQTVYAVTLWDNYSNLVFKNNAFTANSIYHFTNSCTDCVFDNNAFFNSDNHPFSNDYSTLLDWQRGTSYDQQSRWIKPYFVTQPPYKTKNQLSRAITDNAFSAIVPTDIENNARPAENALAGAYEHAPLTTDLVAVEIAQIKNGTAAGQQTLALTIANVGQTPVSDFVINWGVNGDAMLASNHTLTIAPNTEVEVVFGTFDFQFGTTYEIVAEVAPTNVTDNFLPNNLIDQSGIVVRMQGTYTVGGDNADFSSVQGALEKLQEVGVVGDVAFSINPGNYPLDIRLGDYFNAPYSKLTITSSSQDANDVTIEVNNQSSIGFIVDHIQELSLEYVSIFANNFQNDLLHFSGNIDNLLINNCKLHSNTSSSSNRSLVFFAQSATMNNLTIIHTIFENHRLGISNHFSGINTESILIKNNQLINQYTYGMHVGSFHNALIEGNTFIKEDNNSGGYFALSTHSSYQLQIIRNSFHINNHSGRVIRLSNNTSLRDTPTQPIKVFNNFIYGKGEDLRGVELDNLLLGGIEFRHNTISGDMEHNYYSRFSPFGNSVEVVEGNLFVNNNGSTFYRINSNSNELILNYNNYFSNGNSLAYMNSRHHNSLVEWQDAERSHNQNSINVAPNFTPFDSYFTIEEELAGVVPFNSNISTDIENNQRPTDFTAVGCYEISAAPALAIDVLQFTTQLTDNQTVKLNWKTLTDNAIRYFIVQRATDAQQFITIGEVDAGAQNSYQFIDQNPLNGQNFYRLAAVMKEGKVEYSLIKLVDLYGNHPFQLYPNPATDKLQIDWKDSTYRPNKVILVDVLGQTISLPIKILQLNNATLDISSLTKGTYFVKIQTVQGWHEQIFLKL